MVDKKIIVGWLKDNISPPLSRCFVFGSALERSTPNDVDVVIIALEWNVRDILSRLRMDFRAKFQLPLHIQPFHISQVTEIKIFFDRIHRWEDVV